MLDTAVDVLMETLLAWNVNMNTVFGLPGDGINSVMEALRVRDKVRFIQVRMRNRLRSWPAPLPSSPADSAYAWRAGGIHLLNGLYDAKMDGAPVLAIADDNLKRDEVRGGPGDSRLPRD